MAHIIKMAQLLAPLGKGLGGGGLTADIKRIERLCTVLDVVLSFIVENIQR